MAKNRYVNTKFWTDTYVSDLDPLERLVFLYLLTNPSTNISGVYEITTRRIAFDTGLDREVTEKIIGRFERDGKLIYREGWVALKNFIKHQQLNPKVNAGISYELELAPKELVRFINRPDFVPQSKKKRTQLTKTQRVAILERDNHTCQLCGLTAETEGAVLEIDHIKPVAVGGDNHPSNLRVLCQTCNGKRNAGLRWGNNGWETYSSPIKMGSLSHSNSNFNSNLTKEETEQTPSAHPISALSFLENLSEEKLEALRNQYQASKTEIQTKAADLVDYCRAHGKTYKDYNALLHKSLRKDFGLRAKTSRTI